MLLTTQSGLQRDEETSRQQYEEWWPPSRVFTSQFLNLFADHSCLSTLTHTHEGKHQNKSASILLITKGWHAPMVFMEKIGGAMNPDLVEDVEAQLIIKTNFASAI